MNLLRLTQIECLSLIRISIIPVWLEHMNSNNAISVWNVITRWVSSLFKYECALIFFDSPAYSNCIKNNETVYLLLRHFN